MLTLTGWEVMLGGNVRVPEVGIEVHARRGRARGHVVVHRHGLRREGRERHRERDRGRVALGALGGVLGGRNVRRSRRWAPRPARS